MGWKKKKNLILFLSFEKTPIKHKTNPQKTAPQKQTKTKTKTKKKKKKKKTKKKDFFGAAQSTSDSESGGSANGSDDENVISTHSSHSFDELRDGLFRNEKRQKRQKRREKILLQSSAVLEFHIIDI